jgi:HlyD family secretion protein
MKKLISLLCLLGLASVGLCDEGTDKQPRAAFRTAAVKRGQLEVTVQATGTVEPEEIVEVGAQVAGQVQELGRDPGDAGKTIDSGGRVEAGTILAQLDPRVYRAQVDQAKAALQRAEAELAVASGQLQLADLEWQRARKLNEKVLPQHEKDLCQGKYDVARARTQSSKAAVKERQAAVRLAELNLDYCTIRSPIQGIIIDRRVNVGQTVAPGLAAPSLFLIARDLKHLQVWASVNEADIGQVRGRQAVTFTVDACPGQVFRGEVEKVRLNASLTQGVVTYTVVVNVDNAGGKLLPSLTADVRVLVARREDALLVSNAALRWRPQLAQVVPEHRKDYERSRKTDKESPERHVVWAMEKGLVRPVTVRIGLTDGTRTEIVDGDLPEGTEVVTGTEAPPMGRAKEQGPGGGAKRLAARLEGQNLLVLPGTPAKESPHALTIADAEAIARECPSVGSAAPLRRARAQAVYGDRSWVPPYIYATTPAYLKVRDWQELQEGDMFTDRDARTGNKVCVLGETVSHELFGDASPIGKTIRLGGTSFRVIGLLGHKGENMMGLDQDDIVLVPWMALEAIKGTDKVGTSLLGPSPDAVAPKAEKTAVIADQLLVRARSVEAVSAASREITELLRQRHHIAPGQPDDFNIRDLTELFKALKALEGRSR